MWPVSQTFLKTLSSPVITPHTRLVVLDTDFNPVAGGTFDGVAFSSDATSVLVDGSVDVDTSRGTRRTFTVSLNNPGGVWSPNHQWAGLFYVNRLVRIYRGFNYGGASELVPVGTFYIDTPTVVVERNMSMVVLAGSDQWKRFTKSKFPHPKKWAAGTPINDVIRDIAGNAMYPNPGAGVTRFRLDDLSSRDADARTLNVALTVEQKDDRGAALLKLAKDYGLEIYFDPLGYLTTDDLRNDGVSYVYDMDRGGAGLSLRVGYKDDNFYNHAVVIGTGGSVTVTAHHWDDDPTSPTNITRVGDQTFIYESDSISTIPAAQAAADRIFRGLTVLNEDIEFDAICNPALEGNDVVGIKETSFAGVNRNYRVVSFNVPLTSARQTMKLGRVIDI